MKCSHQLVLDIDLANQPAALFNRLVLGDVAVAATLRMSCKLEKA